MFDIGGGKSLWQGIYTSVRPAWKIFFNVDMANKPAYEEQGGYLQRSLSLSNELKSLMFPGSSDKYS